VRAQAAAALELPEVAELLGRDPLEREVGGDARGVPDLVSLLGAGVELDDVGPAVLGVERAVGDLAGQFDVVMADRSTSCGAPGA
jgi:hypothetical protein